MFVLRTKPQENTFRGNPQDRQINRKQSKTALQWFTNGKKKSETVEKIETLSFRDTVRKADITPQEMDFILEQWKNKGLLKTYVVTGSKKDIVAYDFMLTFWTWEKSEYIAEKLRKKSRHREKARFKTVQQY